MGGRDARPNTIHRPKHRARVVVSLEVEVDMTDQPRWQRDATDVLRGMDLHPHMTSVIRYLADRGVKVLGQKLEVAK